MWLLVIYLLVLGFRMNAVLDVQAWLMKTLKNNRKKASFPSSFHLKFDLNRKTKQKYRF